MHNVFRIALRRMDEAQVVTVTGELDIARFLADGAAGAEESDVPTSPPIARAGE
jgi:hypothetical protein